jgi:uncharacterized protein (TIGR02231 family)
MIGAIVFCFTLKIINLIYGFLELMHLIRNLLTLVAKKSSNMKKTSFIAFMLLLSVAAFSQQEKKVDSKITNVTVFLSKAQVTRTVKSRIEAGKTNLIVTGLTSQLDQQSIQVAGKGNFVILGIAHQQNFLTELNTPQSLQVLKDSLQLLQNQLLRETSQKEILNREEQMLLANQKIGGTNQNLTAAELKAMADFFRSRMSDIVTARMKQDEKIKKLNEGIAKVQRQVDEQQEMYSRNTSEIVISLSAEAPVNVDLDVNYIVANAGWYAVYDLRAINTKSPITLSYKANVFQSTGEEWKNVRLKLSTANPNLSGLKPELYAWYLNFYEPVERALQGRAAGVRYKLSAPAKMEDDSDMAEEKSASGPAETSADFVTTIQTTLNTEFDIALPYTVNSASKPTLVDIRNHELKADYIYSVTPKLDRDAFLLARATGWEEFSLVPGDANIFFEGTFVGKSYIDPNSIKDTLAISLGRDKRIVVKREKLKDFSSKKMIGTNQRASYAYKISVRNTKAEDVKIIVEDQIPVSQNSQIEVAVSDTGQAKYNTNTGKLTWEMNLKPNESKEMVYKFEVKYPKDKTIAGLD